jgi:transcriptional regulator with XRE-family HTH domain
MGTVEVPASAIRAITNPDYGRFSERCWRYSNRSIGAHVRRLRERQGLTQQELARRIGARQPNIARIERGEREPGIATESAILAALDAGWEDMTISDDDYGEFLQHVERVYRKRKDESAA